MRRSISVALGSLLIVGVALSLLWLVPMVSGEKALSPATPTGFPSASGEQGQPGAEGVGGKPQQPGTEVPAPASDLTPGAVPIGGPYSDQELERLKKQAESAADVPCGDAQADSGGSNGPVPAGGCPTPTP